MKYNLPKNDVITWGIGLLKLVGEFTPYKSELAINIYRCVNCVVLLLNAILLLANLSKAVGDMYVEILGSTGLFAHGLLRYICFVSYKSEILSLLNDIQRFWNIRQIKHIHRFAKRQYAFSSAALTILVVLGTTSIIIYCFKPLAAKQGLMFPARIVADFIGFQIGLLFSQYYGLLIIATVVCGYDVIYICYSVQVIIQIRMLKYRFQHITRYVDIGTIKSYIRHHQFMLQIFDRMKDIYFWMFFFLYALTLLSGCSQLYVIIAGDTEVSEFLISVLYFVALFTEFGLYTTIVEEVVAQFTDIASSVYNCSWYDRSLEDRRVLLFVMMKGQRQSYFSAGGLAVINVDTFGSKQTTAALFLSVAFDK